MFSKVKEFHRVFGQNISEVPTLPEAKERDLRIRLLQEELDEFCQAFDDDDIVLMSDGLCDICYVIAGTCVSYGICPEGEFGSPYEMLGQIHVFYNIPLDRVLREDFTDYMNAEAKNELDAIKDCLIRMMLSTYAIGLHLGIPMTKMFEEVHRSNMTKVDHTGKPNYRHDGKLLKPDHWSPPDIKGILDRVNSDPTTPRF